MSDVAIEVNSDSKTSSILVWVLTIFFGFIPGLIFFMTKKDDQFVLAHSREALNWSITALICWLGALVLTFAIIGAFLFPVLGICHLVFCILGAVAASSGKPYKTPFAIRLIK